MASQPPQEVFFPYMKMIHKMIAVFSLLAILTTAANSIYFYNTRMADLNDRTYEHLKTLSARVVSEIEQYIQLMDYAIESLSSNPDFMEAFCTAARLDDESDLGEAMAAENLLSRRLYQEPILEPFYRVSVYSRNGFFISSRLENSSRIPSMSEQALDIIDGLSYLAKVDARPFRRQIIGPHEDPWVEDGAAVFTVVRSVAWHGQRIGYIEVNAHLDELAEMFLWHETDGFLVQGIFDDGSMLFRNYGDDVVYTDLNPDGLTRVQADGVDRLVVAA